MMPVVRGKPATRRQILIYSLVLVPLGILPAAIGLGGPLYLAASAGLGALLLWNAFAILRETDETREPRARRMFAVTIFYLFSLFAALIAEHLDRLPRPADLDVMVDEDGNARERHRRNIALALVLVGLVVLFYAMSIVRVHWSTVREAGHGAWRSEARLSSGRSQPVAGRGLDRRLHHAGRRRVLDEQGLHGLLRPAGERPALDLRGRGGAGALHHGGLVARRDRRIRGARRPHAGGQARPALRHGAVHRLGGDVLRRLVLGLFQYRAVPQRCRRLESGRRPAS